MKTNIDELIPHLSPSSGFRLYLQSDAQEYQIEINITPIKTNNRTQQPDKEK